VDADQRRQEVARLLADNPAMTQRAIAKALGVSQASVARDVAALRESRVNQSESLGITAPPQASRGEALVARKLCKFNKWRWRDRGFYFA
jgi:DeoR/GlpR family transcriptional regulator of sugar metabolism